MSTTITAADIHLLDLTTRLPFRYGIATMTETPHAFVRVHAMVDGVETEGVAADHLPPKWFTKDAQRSIADEIDEMLAVVEHAVGVSVGLEAETVFDLWQLFYERQSTWGKSRGLPSLLTHFGTSLIERALIDAFCRAKQSTFAAAVRTNAFGIRLGEFDPNLVDNQPADFLPGEPLHALTIRQTLGMADAITDDAIPEEERVSDGLPQSLAELVDRYGFRHFKIKISGDAVVDVDRLRGFFSLMASRGIDDFQFTVDGNELFRALAEFRDYWKTIFEQTELREQLPRLLFVEQPLHRDVALDPARVAGLKDWVDRPPIIIDESDADLDSLPRALELGYDGTSHKNCKGVIKSLVNACRLESQRRRNAGTGRPLVMSVEDLVNIGPVALLQDLAVAATLGITSVERNGHHYFAGLSAFPESVQTQMLTQHADLYERGDAGYPVVNIENGAMQVATIVDAPFGVGFALDVESFPAVNEWRAERSQASRERQRPESAE